MERPASEQSFCVPKPDIVVNDFDLSINRYKEIVYDEVPYDSPGSIIDELQALEVEIQMGLLELRTALG